MYINQITGNTYAVKRYEAGKRKQEGAAVSDQAVDSEGIQPEAEAEISEEARRAAQAQKAAKKNDAQDYFKNKLAELKSAAESLSKAAEEAPRQNLARLLSSLIQFVRMLNGMQFASDTWSDLMEELGSAEAVSINSEASIKDIKKALNGLRSAVSALRQAEKEDVGLRDSFPIVMDINAAVKGAAAGISVSGAAAPVAASADA